MSNKIRRQTRPYTEFDGKIGLVSVTRMDVGLVILVLVFMGLVVVQSLLNGDSNPFSLLRQLHFHLSRFSLVIAIGMFVLAGYIRHRRNGDVTPYFRRGVYVVVGTMLLEALFGLAMFVLFNARPHDDVHLIYGMASVLALPFFIFVEVTAEKRPAMASYIWGFAILAGVIIRSIGTGAV